jgi:hypothetical protein
MINRPRRGQNPAITQQQTLASKRGGVETAEATMLASPDASTAIQSAVADELENKPLADADDAKPAAPERFDEHDPPLLMNVTSLASALRISAFEINSDGEGGVSIRPIRPGEGSEAEKVKSVSLMLTDPANTVSLMIVVADISSSVTSTDKEGSNERESSDSGGADVGSSGDPTRGITADNATDTVVDEG